MKKRFISVLLILIFTAGLLPTAYADEISKVSIRIYPDSSYGYDNNQDPIVGGQAGDVYALVSAGDVILDQYYLMDGGSAATGKIEDKNYTFYASVLASGGSLMTQATTASVNNSTATISVSEDGTSAIITATITPRLEGPCIYQNPTSETHPAGETFSFVASAGNYNTFQWYIKTPYNITYTAEEAYSKVGLSATVTDNGSYVKCNLHSVTDNFDGWMVYCGFTGDGGYNETSYAMINIEGSSGTDSSLQQGITVVETPEPTSEIWIVETPEPTSEIWVVETPEPTVEPTTDVQEQPETETETTTEKEHKGLKIIGIAAGILVVLCFGLVGTQYMIDKKKREKRAKSNDAKYRGRH